jgi:membrane protein YdbS with pleckstrin-like domain
MTTLQQTIAEIVLLVLTLVQPRSNCWHLMWLMAANVFLILPSNLKSTEYKNKLDDWILAVTSAKMFVNGIVFQNRTTNRCSNQSF